MLQVSDTSIKKQKQNKSENKWKLEDNYGRSNIKIIGVSDAPQPKNNKDKNIGKEILIGYFKKFGRFEGCTNCPAKEMKMDPYYTMINTSLFPSPGPSYTI